MSSGATSWPLSLRHEEDGDVLMEQFDYDVAIIGSGFGGSVSALRLTEKGYKVLVIEAGRRFEDGDFPKTSWRTNRFPWAPAFGCYGIQRIHLLPDAIILAGAGVGGGSLVYANTLYVPPGALLQGQAVGTHHRLAVGTDAVLRPGQAHARRGAEPDDDPVRHRAEGSRRRDGRG